MARFERGRIEHGPEYAITSWAAIPVFGAARATLIGCALLTALSALAGMAPLIAVVEVSRRLLAGDTAVWAIIAAALVALAVKQLGTFCAGVLTHLADIQVSFRIRRDLLVKLSKLPLGWFTDRNSGIVKKTVEDDVSGPAPADRPFHRGTHRGDSSPISRLDLPVCC